MLSSSWWTSSASAATSLATSRFGSATQVRPGPSSVQLVMLTENGLEARSAPDWGRAVALEAFDSGLPQLVLGDLVAFQLRGGDRRLGILVARSGQLRQSPHEIAVFLPLLALAIQRCQLAERLAEADVFKKSEGFKTALLSSVSHDLRTPLAAIAASAGSLMEFGDADPRFEFIGRWVGLLAEAREEVRTLVTEAEPALLARYAERASVLVSLRHLTTYPWIAERVEAGTLSLHGWYFDFTWGVLMAAETPRGPFRQIDAADLPRAAVGGSP